jgi:hypothetical protein
VRIPAFVDFLFQNGSIEFCFRVEVPENNGFVDVGLGGKVARSGTAKAISRKDFHGGLEDVLALVVF